MLYLISVMKMISNGIDMIEIDRIKKSIESETFLKEVYGSEELLSLKGKKPQSYAAAFCAKEAFSKALGTGIRGFSLNEVEVLHDGLGKPYFKLSGEAERLCREKGLQLSLSITHTENYAAAVVTAYSE